MSNEFERDRSIERLLRSAPHDPASPASSTCLDPERLAAWSEGGLTVAEAALVEGHLADCGRCQSILATFAATHDAAALPHASRAAVRPWRRGHVVRWALPLAGAAAAAALMFWVAVPRQTDSPAGVVPQSAKLEPAREPIPPELRASPPPMSVAPDPIAAAPREDRRTTPALGSQTQVKARDVSSMLKTLPGAVDPRGSRDFAAWNSGRNLSISGGNSLNKNTTIDGVPIGERDNGRTYITPNIDAVAEINVTSSIDPIQFPLLETSIGPGVPAAAPAPSRAVAAGRGGGRTGAPTQVRWRVFRNGRVDRSLTNGSSWETVSIDPGLAIVNGAAPGANVCWLIGRRGVVLRTVDGGTRFVRVDVQDAPNLTAVRAVDELRATVTTSDGRTFSTINGGASWRLGTF